MRARIWILGACLALALGLVLAVQGTPGAIEAGLQSRVAAALSGQQVPVSGAVAGREVILTGDVGSREQQRELVALVSGIPGVAAVNDRTTIVATVSPYVWSVARDGRNVRLAGVVPSDQVRQALLARSREVFAGHSVTDDMRVARGTIDPAGWAQAAGFAVEQTARLQSGQTTLTDQAIVVEGRAADAPAVRDAIERAARAVPAGFTLGRLAVAGPPPIPYQWSVSREGSTVTMTGHLPAADLRVSLVQSLQQAMPGITIVDQTLVAEGAPNAFAPATRLAVARVADLAVGRISVVDNVMTVDGRVAELEPYDRVMRALADRPEGVVLGRVTVAAPAMRPYTLRVQRRPGQPIELAGFVPQEEVRRSWITRLGGVGGVEADKLRIAPGVPAGMDWQAAGEFAVTQALLLRSGTVRLDDQTLVIDGEAVDAASVNALLAVVRGTLPGGLRLGQVNVRPPATGTTGSLATPVALQDGPVDGLECQRLLAALVTDAPIRFARNQTSLEDTAEAVLGRIAATLRRCPDANVEIGGHTDSRGPASGNERLSRERADAVRQWLVRAGVAPARLSAVGYGGARPVAANDTDDGRERNRRIEFTVR